MGTHLVNTYAYLRKSYSDELETLYNTTITYIKTLTNKDENILFVCKKKKDKCRNVTEREPLIIPLTRSVRGNSQILDLTGSPLKDDCEIDVIDYSLDFKLSSFTPWTESEETYSAISEETARSILSDVNLQEAVCSDGKGSLWILCDSNDPALLELSFDFSCNSRSIVRYLGSIPATTIDIAKLTKSHLSLVKAATKVQTSVDNFYNIKPEIVLKLSWVTSALKPHFNLKNADVVLNQSIQVASRDSIMKGFWTQLHILSEIKKEILAFKEAEDDKQEIYYKCGSSITTDLLRERITSILTELTSSLSDESDFGSNDLEAIVLKTRCYDVTDQLWEILKCCDSYKDLKTGFNMIFQCAAKCNVVNMPINENHLAVIIRELSQHRLAVPCLAGSEPLELLLEIGLEKVSKDYDYLFTESKICSTIDLKLKKWDGTSTKINGTQSHNLSVRKSLHNAIASATTNSEKQRKTLLHVGADNNTSSEIIGFQNSHFNKTEIDYKLARLAQIHLLVEHLILMQINLNLDTGVYTQISLKVLKNDPNPFEKTISMKLDSLETSIMSEKVLHRLQNQEPNARRIMMASKNKFRKVENTFFFSYESIFPPNIFAADLTNDTEAARCTLSKEMLYHYWQYTKISTKRN